MLLGVDGTNWVHQLYHANRGLNVLRVAVGRLRALIEHIKPTETVVCFDRRSFRHDLLATYKAGRKVRDTALTDYLFAAPQAFAEVAQVAAQDGFEADDGLATLAFVAFQQGEKAIIASPDKDLRQCLVAGQVTILRGFATDRGTFGKADWFTSQHLVDKYGLNPWQWTDYQTLVGDAGDAIEGAAHWGEKTAAAALVKCGSLDKCFANIWAVPCTNRQRNSLLEFRKRVDLVRQLVTLKTNVEAVHDALR